jgi:hypothetical protein
MKVKVLSPQVAAKIAAGEVVERPASVKMRGMPAPGRSPSRLKAAGWNRSV